MTEISSPAANTIDISSPSAIASQDPASSLRAAALLTLKSKRRKPLNDQITPTLPRPPPPGDSFQLDYGQDDTPSDPVPTPQQASYSSLSSDNPTGMDVDQSREEGEISDEEDVPAPPLKLTPPVSVPTGPRARPSIKKLSTPPRPTKSRFPSPPLAPSFKDRISESQSKAGPSRELLLKDILPPESPLLLIDQDHVRPGLSMRQGEYDVAKDFVLDLLGWGVPPEYLVDCGLSRQIVYYVFNELNLRLPQNLDVTGLLPYNPGLLVVESPSKVPSVLLTSASGPENVFDQLATPPPAAVQTQHPGVATPLNAMDTRPMPDTPGLSNSSDLHDMERQRRQELLARKAVQASRRSKQVAKTSLKATPSSVEMLPDNQDASLGLVPTETVDDFLKSIGSEIEPPSEIVPPTEARLHISEDPRDIDEIPGLSTSRVSRSSSSITPQLPSETLDAQVPPGSADLPPMSPEPPPPSNESAATAFSKMDIDIDEARVVSLSSMLPRRGTKRPVAADFVDFEVDGSNSNGYGFAGLYDADELDRRKMGRSHFSVRKFVIDLSDSDSEMDDQNAKPKITRNVRPRRHPPVRANTSNGWNTPISAAPANTMSPAALEEKEMEIRKMKEMIAQRESNRLKKLSSVTKLASITNGSYVPNPIKQEEDETDEARPSIPLGPESNLSDVGNESGLHSTTPESYEASIIATSSSTSSAITPFADNDVLLSSPDDDPRNYDSVLRDGRLEQAVIDASADGVDQRAQQLATGIESVDVDQELSSSAQVLKSLALSAHPKQEESPSQLPPSSLTIHDEDLFTNYDSLLERYPLLGSHSHILFPGTSTSRMFAEPQSSYAAHLSTSGRSSVLSAVPTHEFSSSLYINSSSSSIPIPNLKPLRSAIASKLLDPLKQVCRYEVPGGGICRDEGCEDVHLSRILGLAGASGMGVEPSDEDTAEYLFNALPEPWRTVHNISISKVLLALQQFTDSMKPLEERAAQAIATLGPPPLPT